MGSTTFSGPVSSTAGFSGDVTGNVYTVATLPATITQGTVLYCSNGAAGAATLVIANTAGTAWVLASDGATAPSAV